MPFPLLLSGALVPIAMGALAALAARVREDVHAHSDEQEQDEDERGVMESDIAGVKSRHG